MADSAPPGNSDAVFSSRCTVNPGNGLVNARLQNAVVKSPSVSMKYVSTHRLPRARPARLLNGCTRSSLFTGCASLHGDDDRRRFTYSRSSAPTKKRCGSLTAFDTPRIARKARNCGTVPPIGSIVLHVPAADRVATPIVRLDSTVASSMSAPRGNSVSGASGSMKRPVAGAIVADDVGPCVVTRERPGENGAAVMRDSKKPPITIGVPACNRAAMHGSAKGNAGLRTKLRSQSQFFSWRQVGSRVATADPGGGSLPM